ncbi:MAG TPA: tRNA pseudouridine(55) synthase TruB [Marmoricola sp.]|nr:tRNA pseudouridine(55) synthase TruB [Marmoricola sp.]
MTRSSPRPPSSTASGLVVVDKPSGLTSHDVVSRVRRLAHTRKVGHAGTLDPMATGVLLLGVNKGTRLLGHLALTDKAYTATVRLGASTTTDDAEGDVVATAPPEDVAVLDLETVRAVAERFVGAIEQVPSSVSAVKVAGRRAYQRVRDGEAVELSARPVTVHELTVGEPAPRDGFLDVSLEVRCSSGTYVRAIARDLGEALGVGGHLTALRRTAVGPVGVAEATPLAASEEAGSVDLMPLEAAARRFFPVVEVDAAGARDVGFGRFLDVDLPGTGPVAVLGPDGAFLALYEEGKVSGAPARPVAVFV